ncbi:hypothetical protein Tco_0502344 [Tanacetum coccineum]
MDHNCEEVNSLLSKLGDMESSIVQQASAEFKSSLPALLLKDSIKSSVSKSIAEELPHVEAQKELSKSLHKNIKKSIRLKVRKEMKEVRDKLSCCTSTVATNSQHVHDLRVMFKDMGEQPSAQVVLNKEKALVVHNAEEKKEGTVVMEDDSDDDDLDKQPLLKRFKVMTPIPNLIPLNTFVPKHLLKPEEQQKDPVKSKEVAIVKEQVNELVTYQEEVGYIPKMPKLKSFITLEGTLSQEEFNNQIKELKRISNLKAQKDKSEQELRKIYVVNPNKEATIKITRGDNPLNLVVYPNFRLKLLGFSEWLEVQALSSKKTGKSNDMLLQSLRAKFQWVMDQAKKLGLPPPPALATFRMTAEEKKSKRT